MGWKDTIQPVSNEKSSWRDSIQEVEQEKPWYSPEKLTRGAIDAIPIAGAIGGGLIAAPVNLIAPGVASIAGAGLGYAGGKELADTLKNRLLGDEATSTNTVDQLKRVAGNTMEGATAEMGGLALGSAVQSAKPALRYAADKTKDAGKALYKSGLKRIDEEAAKYGKEPVSDLLMEHGITGSSKDIFEKMSDLGEELLFKRDAILKKATTRGAEVDVPSSLREAQSYIDSLKHIDNPEVRNAVEMLQSRVDDYMTKTAVEPQDVLRELPKQGVVLPETQMQQFGSYTKPERKFVDLAQQGELAPGASIMKEGRQAIDPNMNILRDPDLVVQKPPVTASYVEPGGFNPGKMVDVPERFIPSQPATVLDQTERISGPSPIQTSAWKTTAANKVGDPAWEMLARSSEGKGFDKALSSGLRRGTEQSVGRTLGPEVEAELAKKNSDLGRILTTEDRALMDAQQEGRKNSITSVDGALSTNPAILATKKLADFSKTTKARTVGGKKLMDISDKISRSLMKSPQMAELSRSNPKVFGAIVENMSQKMSSGASEMGRAAENDKPYDQNVLIQKTQGTKYAQTLQNAAQRGQKAFNAAHFVLQQKDPNYRDLTLQNEDENE